MIAQRKSQPAFRYRIVFAARLRSLNNECPHHPSWALPVYAARQCEFRSLCQMDFGENHRTSRDPLRPARQERPQTGDVQPGNKKRALTRPFHTVHRKQPIPQMLNRLRKPTENQKRRTEGGGKRCPPLTSPTKQREQACPAPRFSPNRRR